jgi:hypothetical protein
LKINEIGKRKWKAENNNNKKIKGKGKQWVGLIPWLAHLLPPL